MPEINTRVKHKRDTSANWTSKNPVLLDGEIIIVDTAEGSVRYKVGDGVKKYKQLPFTDESLLNEFNNKLDTLEEKTIESISVEESRAKQAELELSSAIEDAKVEAADRDAVILSETQKQIADAFEAARIDASDKDTAILNEVQKNIENHEHLYAESDSNGGAATSANKLNTDAGSTTKPVYFKDGKPEAINFSIEKSVPADAKFTDTTYSEATTSDSGLMSPTDKIKLNGIEAGANKIVVDSSLSDTSTNPVQNKVVKSAIASEESRAKEAEKNLQDQINTIMDNPDTEGVINSIKEFTAYIEEDGRIAEGFRLDIEENKKAVEEVREFASENAAVILAEAQEEIANVFESAKIDASDKDAAVLNEVQKNIEDLQVDINSKLEDKSNSDHTHDNRYYTESEADSKFASTSHIHVPADLRLSGSSVLNLDPLTTAIIPDGMTNRSFGMPAEAIKFEYSRDGGTTWTPYDRDGTELFDEANSRSFYLGGSPGEDYDINCMTRVTISAMLINRETGEYNTTSGRPERYGVVDGIYICMSTQGNIMVFDLEKSTRNTPDDYIPVLSSQPLDGWPGRNMYYFTSSIFGGYENQGNNWCNFRVTFRMTEKGTYVNPAYITDIRFYGTANYDSSPVSNTVKNMIKSGRPYTVDGSNKQVVFPEGVKAEKFNDTPAEKLAFLDNVTSDIQTQLDEVKQDASNKDAVILSEMQTMLDAKIVASTVAVNDGDTSPYPEGTLYLVLPSSN